MNVFIALKGTHFLFLFKTSSYLNDVNNFRLFRNFSAEIKIDTLAHILDEQQGHDYNFMHFNM